MYGYGIHKFFLEQATKELKEMRKEVRVHDQSSSCMRANSEIMWLFPHSMNKQLNGCGWSLAWCMYVSCLEQSMVCDSTHRYGAALRATTLGNLLLLWRQWKKIVCSTVVACMHVAEQGLLDKEIPAPRGRFLIQNIRFHFSLWSLQGKMWVSSFFLPF
jgi:hypothetical protein